MLLLLLVLVLLMLTMVVRVVAILQYKQKMTTSSRYAAWAMPMQNAWMYASAIIPKPSQKRMCEKIQRNWRQKKMEFSWNFSIQTSIRNIIVPNPFRSNQNDMDRLIADKHLHPNNSQQLWICQSNLNPFEWDGRCGVVVVVFVRLLGKPILSSLHNHHVSAHFRSNGRLHWSIWLEFNG